MQKDRYLFMPSYSLEPNKCSYYNQVFIRDYENNELRPIQAKSSQFQSSNKVSRSKATIQRKFHNFKISDNAYRNLKRKINWLYYLAKSRHVKTYSGRDIYNFKIGFSTFTLPAKQKTNTQEVTNTIWNQFLTEIRQRTKMENYVWRLEFQKNGNVHYHMVTDTYIDYWFALKVWNRILKNHGYIEDYQKKHQALTFSEYCELYNKDNKTDKNVMAKRYAKGCSNNWEQPNSVDIKSVRSKKAIAFYISKYFSKDGDNNTIKNELDNEDNSSSLRLWFCSRSLSKLKTVTGFCETLVEDLFGYIQEVKDSVCKVQKYATTFYFDIFKAVGRSRVFLERTLKNYAKSMNYQPSG